VAGPAERQRERQGQQQAPDSQAPQVDRSLTSDQVPATCVTSSLLNLCVLRMQQGGPENTKFANLQVTKQQCRKPADTLSI
jgi:hypothetical protein